MKQLSCIGLAGLVWAAHALGATAPIYINTGTVLSAPQIDATAFLNEGTFSVFAGGFLPYETQNTLNFTNHGQMTASPGFRLLYIGDNGYRFPAANIINGSGAVINGAPFVWLEATNIVSRGLLQGDPAGLIRVNGQSVDF